MDADALAAAADRLAACLSHESAAEIWGFRVPGPSVLPALTVDRNRSHCRTSGVTVYRRTLLPQERRTKHGVAVTAPCRTALDLAATRTFEDAVAILDSALESRQVKPHQLAAAAATMRGPRSGHLRRVIAAADGRAQSIPETLIRLWLASGAGVGRVVPQMRLRTRGHPYDLGLPDLRVVIEFQSWQWHGERSVWVRDARWGNQAFAAGWGYVQLVHEDVLLGRDHVIDLVRGRV